jgi:hypothetical protein
VSDAQAVFQPDSGDPLMIDNVMKVTKGWKDQLNGVWLPRVVDRYIEVVYGDAASPSVVFINDFRWLGLSSYGRRTHLPAKWGTIDAVDAPSSLEPRQPGATDDRTPLKPGERYAQFGLVRRSPTATAEWYPQHWFAIMLPTNAVSDGSLHLFRDQEWLRLEHHLLRGDRRTWPPSHGHKAGLLRTLAASLKR